MGEQHWLSPSTTPPYRTTLIRHSLLDVHHVAESSVAFATVTVFIRPSSFAPRHSPLDIRPSSLVIPTIPALIF